MQGIRRARRLIGCAGGSLAIVLALSCPAAWGAEADPDSTTPFTLSIRVLLESGEELQAQRVGPDSYGIRVRFLDGRDSVVTTQVRRITDEQGRDRTKDVLQSERSIWVGGPAPPKVDRPPAIAPRWYAKITGGPLSPVGEFDDLTTTGFGLDLSIERRTKRRETFGLRLEFSEFGGEAVVEEAFAQATGGVVDQLRYRFWGMNAVTRYLLVPDARVVPFLQSSIGAGVLSTSLYGEGGEAGSTAFAFAYDLGVGIMVQLRRGYGVELISTYTSQATTATNLRVAGLAFTQGDGTIRYLQFKAGVARRFGGRGQ